MKNIFTKYKISGNPKQHALHFTLCTDSGYTLLFAMIVASIVLALGVSLLTISRKEFVLSSSATQSSNAFYSADSGLGCAEYWASGNGGYEFATSTYPNTQTNMLCPNSSKQITVYVCKSEDSACSDPFLNNHPPADIGDADYGYGGTYEFTFYVPFSTDGTSNQSCAAVTVERYYRSDVGLGGAEHPYTDITSAGYNIGWDQSGNNGNGNCDNVSPKKVNRTIELTY